MSARGRPLRFVALVTVGWIGGRTAILWSQTGSLPETLHQLSPIEIAAQAEPEQAVAPASAPGDLPRNAWSSARYSYDSPPAPDAPALQFGDPTAVQLALLQLLQIGSADPAAIAAIPTFPKPSQAMPTPAAPDRSTPLPDRWSAGAWFLGRGGQGVGVAPGGGQLGGSQAGIRIAYMLAPRERVAAFARFSTPLSGPGREAALGLEWQPSQRVPLRLLAEQRFGLDGTPGGPGFGAVAGGQGRAAGLDLEGYGQAGAILRGGRIEPYADGMVRLTRPFDLRGVRVSVGAGAWAGAQRDAQRLDVGPTAVLGFDKMRLSLDWRQRIAGKAQPGSGPAVTLGRDF